ncbi:MAG TPA: hypothetical protein VKC65_02800, partial [Gaiellaceae bacterium]|nr:hypothetical protein [Gaiellaceae bacterium]
MDLVGVREPAFVLLREDQLPVREDVVLALRALFDRRLVPCVVQLGRETRSPGVIAVSDGAVLDQDARHTVNLHSSESADPSLRVPAPGRKLFHAVSSADPMRPAATPVGYVLGHSEAELRRLTFQADLIEPITRELLVDAGIEEGMRVLDIGTGRGD